MSLSAADVRRTDAELDAIAVGSFGDSGDPVLLGLAALAASLDQDLPETTDLVALSRAAMDTPMTQARRGGLALTATVALVLSTSGMAAAMSGDPLAPLHYIAHRVSQLVPHGPAQMPGWDLEGSRPIISVNAAGPVAVARHRIDRVRPDATPGPESVTVRSGAGRHVWVPRPSEGTPRDSGGLGYTGGGGGGHRGQPPHIPAHPPGRVGGAGGNPGTPPGIPPVGARESHHAGGRNTLPGEQAHGLATVEPRVTLRTGHRADHTRHSRATGERHGTRTATEQAPGTTASTSSTSAS